MIDAIPDLTHLEGHLFWYLCMVAERTGNRNGKAGEVCLSRSELARRFKVKRFSLTRAIDGLVKAGLVTRDTSGATTCLIMCHYMTPHVPHPDTPCATKSPQPQPEASTYAAHIRSEDEVKTKVKRKKRDRAAKAAPPHPLSGLVSWDKESRQVRLEVHEREDGVWREGEETLKDQVRITANREKLPLRLTNAEWQEGWGRLNGHLMGNPFKTGPKTLPAIVLNWFETDLRRKNNHPQRGKPLAQRIDDKARERMNPNGEPSRSTSLPDAFVGLLESGRERHDR